MQVWFLLVRISPDRLCRVMVSSRIHTNFCAYEKKVTDNYSKEATWFGVEQDVSRRVLALSCIARDKTIDELRERLKDLYSELDTHMELWIEKSAEVSAMRIEKIGLVSDIRSLETLVPTQELKEIVERCAENGTTTSIKPFNPCLRGDWYWRSSRTHSA